MIVRTDSFGTPEEDALRRDITINGLFYNIADFSIIDYVGGMADLDRQVIRTIGDPNERFSQDPVRMIESSAMPPEPGFPLKTKLTRLSSIIVKRYENVLRLAFETNSCVN